MKVFDCLYILLGSVVGIGQSMPLASSDDLVAQCNKGGAVPSIYMLQGLDLSSQVYVITGGDTGMAHAAAISLATKNATIVLGMRGTTGKYLETVQVIRSKSNNPKVYVFHLDLSSFASVKMFASQVAAKYPVIKGILCNAGLVGGLFPLTENGFEMIFQVNYLGHFLLVNMLLPMLKQGHGTMVITSSEWHKIPCGFASLPTNCTDISALPFSATRQFHTKGYGHTNNELAQWLKVFWATELAKRHKDISVFSFNPGLVDTPTANASMSWIMPPGVSYDDAIQAFKGFQADVPMTPDEGAAALVHFATAQLHNQSGGYFSLCKPVESAVDTMIQDHGEKFAADYLSALFDLSMHWTSESVQRKSEIFFM